MIPSRRQVVPFRPGTRERRPRVRSSDERLEGLGLGERETVSFRALVLPGGSATVRVGGVRGPIVVEEVQYAQSETASFLSTIGELRVSPPGPSLAWEWANSRVVGIYQTVKDNVTWRVEKFYDFPQTQVLAQLFNWDFVNQIIGVGVTVRPLLAAETIADPLGSSLV